jgi:predicted NBD/HSP70 family sugar kinase
LESTVSDEAVLSAARKAGILPASGPNSSMAALLRIARRDEGSDAGDARELLGERARILGGAVALLRDMLNPDHVVVGGQAFTDYPEGIRAIQAAFAQRSVLGGRDIALTRFGPRVQEAGAGIVSLSSLYNDPIGALRRSNSRRPQTHT